jgi:hypothetical protein
MCRQSHCRALATARHGKLGSTPGIGTDYKRNMSPYALLNLAKLKSTNMSVTTFAAKITIVEAIKAVMRQAGRPLTYQEVYELIAQQGLYKFRAADAVHIVRTEIRRHAEGVELRTASRTKHFRIVEGFRYELLDRAVPNS